MTSRLREPYYMSRIGHRWATQAVAYKTLHGAVRAALLGCGDADRTDVYDCSAAPSGDLVASFDRSGELHLNHDSVWGCLIHDTCVTSEECAEMAATLIKNAHTKE